MDSLALPTPGGCPTSRAFRDVGYTKCVQHLVSRSASSPQNHRLTRYETATGWLLGSVLSGAVLLSEGTRELT
jgi:hypothetical protein